MIEITSDVLLRRWLPAFILTLVVEVPLFVLIARRIAPPLRAALAGALCSVITHPLLWFVWPLAGFDRVTYIVSGELLVALIETLVFFLVARPVPLLRAAAASFIANSASYAAGVVGRSLGLY